MYDLNENKSTSSDDENNVESKILKLPFKHLIIDCSPIFFIDTVGCKTIKQVI